MISQDTAQRLYNAMKNDTDIDFEPSLMTGHTVAQILTELPLDEVSSVEFSNSTPVMRTDTSTVRAGPSGDIFLYMCIITGNRHEHVLHCWIGV